MLNKIKNVFCMFLGCIGLIGIAVYYNLQAWYYRIKKGVRNEKI